jgi:hypothetical protein
MTATASSAWTGSSGSTRAAAERALESAQVGTGTVTASVSKAPQKFVN